MTRIGIAMVVGLVFALGSTGDAFACSCLPADLVRDLPRADGAFVGTLLEHSETGQSATYLFRVEQVYKGDIENRVEVITPLNGAACGLEVSVGNRIGLLLERGGGAWHSGLCSQVDPAAFVALTNAEVNGPPPVNWGGIVVGVLVLGAGTFVLVRRLRR